MTVTAGAPGRFGGASQTAPFQSSVATKHRRDAILTLICVTQAETSQAAAKKPDVVTRLLVEWEDLQGASRVVSEVWGDDETLAPPSLLRAYTHNGNPVIGAFVAGQLCGASIGFLGPEPKLHLHSHITGVVPALQHMGVGFHLKLAQQEWCRANGIDLVTWTFDPMLARNAYFNLQKLGATAVGLLPSFYGQMEDRLNRGEDTDRLEVAWHLDRVTPPDTRATARTVAIPEDYLSLRDRDSAAAQRARREVRKQLAQGFADGLVIVGFDRRLGYRFAGK